MAKVSAANSLVLTAVLSELHFSSLLGFQSSPDTSNRLSDRAAHKERAYAVSNLLSAKTPNSVSRSCDLGLAYIKLSYTSHTYLNNRFINCDQS